MALASLHLTHANSLTVNQPAFGYTHEELVVVLRPMVENRAEVTNPPIDYIRKEHVMSLRVRIGPRSTISVKEPTCALPPPPFALRPRRVRRPIGIPFTGRPIKRVKPLKNESTPAWFQLDQSMTLTRPD